MDDEIVFAIDVRPAALDEARAAATAEVAPPPPPVPVRPVRTVALLVDDGDPLLLPIAPTRDVRLLDALGRLLRWAALLDLPVSEVADRYGGAYERRTIARLPPWATSGIDSPRVPAALRGRVSPCGSGSSPSAS